MTDEPHAPPPADSRAGLASQLSNDGLAEVRPAHEDVAEIQPDLATYRAVGEQLLQQGEPLVAYDRVAEGLERYPDDLRLRQLAASALARSGASGLANEHLHRLVDAGHVDEETLGFLARTHKDLSATATGPSEAQAHLRQANHYYAEAHRRFGSTWGGINAATTALLLGRNQESRDVARQVLQACLDDTHAGAPPSYWLLATMAEAALLLGNLEDAENWYGQAGALAGARLGDIVSTRRNARLILRHLNADDARVEACFRVPEVVVFVGHLVDRPGRTPPRFPDALEPAVRDAVRAWLEQRPPIVGFASAACGGDILFHEQLIASHAETNVVLPYNRAQFVPESVDVVPGSAWPARFERVLAGARSVTTASEQRIAGDMAYEYGFRVLDGMAALRADELDTPLTCLAVWDGQPGGGEGGTSTSVARWRQAGRQVHIINLAELSGHQDDAARTREIAAPGPSPASNTTGRRLNSHVVGLLFADVQGFSRLNDDDIPHFVEQVPGAVARELAATQPPPRLRNTWGDGFYFVFDSIRTTGYFALRLSDLVSRTDWRTRGLSIDLNIRIGLHAGPAYACLDPVTGAPNYFGAHVSRAARIEPVTPPGQVYASAPFAALARAEGVREFRCMYVGRTPLAKGYGTSPTYVVRRVQHEA